MKKLRLFAKKLRKKSTDTENKLWVYLKNRRFHGLKFRRQEPIGPYIVDFVCYEKRIVIECDGSQHLENQEKDKQRDLFLQNRGFRVFRFWNNQIFEDLDTVLEVLYEATR